MIPKVIHYCWFGGNEMSALEKKMHRELEDAVPGL